MKDLKFDLNLMKQKAPFLLLCLIMFFPLLEVKTVSKLLLFFFSISIFFNLNQGIKSLKFDTKKHLVINSFFFIVLIVSILYSINKGEAFKTITRQLSFLMFPLIFFYFIKLSKKELFYLATCFVIANIFSTIYLSIYISSVSSFYDVAVNNFDFRSLISQNTFKEWHPTYLGVFNLTSIILLIEYLFTLKKPFKKIIIVLIISFLIGSAFILNSRSVFYALILLVPSFVFIKLKSKKGKIIFFVILLPVLGVLAYLLKNNFSLNYRLVLQIEKIFSWFVDSEVSTSGIDVRYFINQCNYELFLQNPIFGLGVGDVKYNLTNCYLDNEFNLLFESRMNSHNNYFYLLLAGGLLALISFLALMFYNVWRFLKNKNFVGLFIFIALLVVFMTESFFVRLSGIVFFCLANSIMYYHDVILKEN